MTLAERRARQIDRDKRAAELAAMLALLPLLGTAADFAGQAIRIGTDPVAAASAVLSGSAALHQPGIGPVFATAATAGWLLGQYRSRAYAAERATGQAVDLGRFRDAIRATPNLWQPSAEQAPVIRRMIGGVGGEAVVRARYARALEQTRPLVANIETRVARHLNRITVGGPALELSPPPGAHVPDAIGRAMDEARLAFERAGVGSRTSWYVPARRPLDDEPNVSANAEALVEAVVGQEYEEGRDAGTAAAGNGDEEPPARAVKPKLWGFTWSSFIDGRRCKYCRKLHGMTAPVGHPVWQELRPLLHFGCRCSRIDRYIRPGQAAPLLFLPDMTDPDIIAAKQMRLSLLRWWHGISTAR